jgi:hypothetical protein
MNPSMAVRRTILLLVTAVLGACAAPAPAPAPGPAPADAAPVTLGKGLVVDRLSGEVRMDCQVAMEHGWLEQAVCLAGTREHESLLATEVAPSRLHAALLLLGLEPGAPGSWREVPKGDAFAVERIPPRGPRLDLLVRVAGRPDAPLDAWIHDPVANRAFPAQPWIFGGSVMRPNRPPEPGQHYVADRTGSVVGIVTFGDEVIGCADVFADRTEIDAASWQARTEAMPPAGTPVVLVIRAHRDR